MPIEQYRDIMLLHRLRDRARGAIVAHRKAGNRAVAEIYMHIETWLDAQLAFAVSGARR